MRLLPRNFQQRHRSLRLVRRTHERRPHHQRNRHLRRLSPLAPRHHGTETSPQPSTVQVPAGTIHRLLGDPGWHLHHHDIRFRHFRSLGHEGLHHELFRRGLFCRALRGVEGLAQDAVYPLCRGGYLDGKGGNR
jgi:hypothetical protein